MSPWTLRKARILHFRHYEKQDTSIKIMKQIIQKIKKNPPHSSNNTGLNCGPHDHEKLWKEKEQVDSKQMSTGNAANTPLMGFGYNLTLTSNLKLSVFERRRLGWWNNCLKYPWYSLAISHLLAAAQAASPCTAFCGKLLLHGSRGSGWELQSLFTQTWKALEKH